MTMIGRAPCWIAVAISWPLIMKPPSPTNATTSRPGCTSDAATAAGVP
jgi:hypothetical protein